MAQVHSPSATEAHHAHALEGANVSWCFVVLVGKLPRVFEWDEMLDVFFWVVFFNVRCPLLSISSTWQLTRIRLALEGMGFGVKETME